MFQNLETLAKAIEIFLLFFCLGACLWEIWNQSKAKKRNAIEKGVFL